MYGRRSFLAGKTVMKGEDDAESWADYEQESEVYRAQDLSRQCGQDHAQRACRITVSEAGKTVRRHRDRHGYCTACSCEREESRQTDSRKDHDVSRLYDRAQSERRRRAGYDG